MKGHPLFRVIWLLENLLLVLSAVYLIYALSWEYSTRQYLRGFSDAVLPSNAAPEEKVQSILEWMKSGPARRNGLVTGDLPLRNPEETLNYGSLLRVCGSATNAFINLAVTGGLDVRRLLLLNASGSTTHVDAEVWIDGRWIVVDPTFRIILRGPDGALLTRQQLKSPGVVQAATHGIKNYLPDYSFEHTAHLHLARVKFLGPLVGKILTALLPGWDKSAFMTLFVEREPFAAFIFASFLLVSFFVIRVGSSWYADVHLAIERVRLTERLRRGTLAFFKQPS